MKNKISHFSIAILITLLLFVSRNGKAQSTDTLKATKSNPWIQKMDDKIALDISFNNAYETFQVETSNTKVNLYPNTPRNLALTVNYSFISFGLQYAPDYLPGNNDKSQKGNTRSFKMGGSMVLKHLFGHASYSKVKGYYLENTSDYVNGWKKTDPYIQFPDLHYEGIAVGMGYSSNKNYSIRNVSSQTERQLKSAGSFILHSFFRYYLIDDRSNNVNKQKSSNFETSIGPGYAYTFVLKNNFYFSLGAQTQLGYLHTKLSTQQDSSLWVSFQDNLILRWELSSALGYNAERYYGGINATLAGARYGQQYTNAMNSETNVYYHIFLGLRLDAPKFVQQQMARIESLLP